MTHADLSPAQLFSLVGKTALVTGSSRGIGRAFARGLAAAGGRVAVHGAGPSVALDAISAELRVPAIAADLATPEGVSRLIAEAPRPLDILVLNASIEVREDWNAITDEAFTRQVAVDLDATRKLIDAFVPDMLARGWGRVIAIGSVQEVKEHPKMLIYASLKAARTSMMRNLARQLSGRGVTFNSLAPGAIATDRNAAVLADPAYRARVEAAIPSGRVGHVDDCVGALLLLASDAGRYITGQRLLVDGGMSL
jgi:glucose 1-dehydrogenase